MRPTAQRTAKLAFPESPAWAKTGQAVVIAASGMLISGCTSNTISSQDSQAPNVQSAQNASQFYKRAVTNNGPVDAKLPVVSVMPPVDRTSILDLVEADGTTVDGLDTLQQVTFAGEGADFDPVISRDGKTIVFASTQHRATADLYVKVVGSRSVTQLTQNQANDVMPALSPDNKRVAFASDRQGTYHLYVMSISGGQAIQLTSGPQTDLHPTWSPDGQRVAFCRMGMQSGRWELWVLSLSNSATPEFIGYGTMPVWCPAPGTGFGGSDKIAFQRAKERGDRAYSIWTVDYKPGSVSNPTEIIAANEGLAAINPSFSPDGQWLAYAAVHPKTVWKRTEQMAEIPQASDIRFVSLVTGTTASITGGQFRNVMPTWGVDGRVYFVSDRATANNIWSISTERAMAAAGFPSPATAHGGQPMAANAGQGVADAAESEAGKASGAAPAQQR